MGKSKKNSTLIIRGREISESDIALVRQMISEHPHRKRSHIAQMLAQKWDWRQRNGCLKDRACRSILTGLEKLGFIKLPASKIIARSKQDISAHSKIEAKIDTSAVEGHISDFLPLRIERVEDCERRFIWAYVIRTYHYVGYQVLVGENLKYLVYSRNRLIAALGWQSAVERLACRDTVIGWTPQQRQRYLHRVANNVRFLIMPWVKILNAASYILAKNISVLNKDWEEKYGHCLWLLETFVDPKKFRGTCYQAANWINIGETKGFRKKSGIFSYHGQSKEVYLYVLDQKMRQKIKGDNSESLLTHEFLLSMRNQERTLKRRNKMIIRHEGWNPDIEPNFDLTAEDIDNLADELEKFHSLFEEGFNRIEQKDLSLCYLQGLLSKIERKSIEPIAIELRGTNAVRNLQRFLSEYKWDEGFIAQRHKEEVSKILAQPDGVFSVDSSEFLKKGKESVGVSRQYCGRYGKVDNCQSGVFVTYTSSKGYALIERRLFMPQGWFSDEQEERRKRCKVPEDLTFKKKTEIGAALIQQLWKSGLFPGRWVTCDTIFGNSDDFLANLPKELYYLAEIACTRKVWSKADQSGNDTSIKSKSVSQIAQDKDLSWKRIKLAEGAKGPIVADVTRLRVFICEDYAPDKERWLFLRKDPESGEVKYCLSNAPENISFEEMIRVCILRWPIEQSFQEGKSELGMADYEHRSWPAWHRHMSFVFLAQLFLLKIRYTLKKNAGIDASTGKVVDRSCFASYSI